MPELWTKIDYETLTDIPEDQRADLPAREHVPVFDGIGRPSTWICRVCWGDGWASGWPCQPAITGGVEIARLLGLEYSA